MYLDDVVSPDECTRLTNVVNSCNQLAFWSPLGRKNDEARAFRDADTVEMHNTSLAAMLWDRIKHIFLDDPSKCVYISEEDDRELAGVWVPSGLNHDLLFAKYPSGGSFAPHTDGRATHDFNRRSFESVIIFLNDLPEGCGGGTRFYQDDALNKLKRAENNQWTADSSLVTEYITPRAGRVLIFDQSLIHEGDPPLDPFVKIIIRSDIMYERTPAVCTSEKDKEAYSMFQRAENLAEEGNVDESCRLFSRAWKMSPLMAKMMGQA